MLQRKKITSPPNEWRNIPLLYPTQWLPTTTPGNTNASQTYQTE